MQSSYFVLGNSHKGVSKVFMMIPFNVGPAHHGPKHACPQCGVQYGLGLAFGLVLSKLGIGWVILSIL
jgi:hypothetical protein